jgi:hypothetical protein
VEIHARVYYRYITGCLTKWGTGIAILQYIDVAIVRTGQALDETCRDVAPVAAGMLWRAFSLHLVSRLLIIRARTCSSVLVRVAADVLASAVPLWPFSSCCVRRCSPRLSQFAMTCNDSVSYKQEP